MEEIRVDGERQRAKPLDRDVVKYIAMFTMLLNHIAHVFLARGTFLYELFVDLGYFTAVTMCYFLVEGYRYTRSKKKYIGRLLVFAVISELPFCLAFSGDTPLSFCGLNMMFTLSLCFAILLAQERVKNTALRVCIIAVLTAASVICDWPLLAPVFTLLFVWAGQSRKRTGVAYLIAMALFWVFCFAEGMWRSPPLQNALYALGAVMGIALSGACIIWLYNGRRMEKGRAFSKWFFYLFYPAHLLVLGLLRLFFVL